MRSFVTNTVHTCLAHISLSGSSSNTPDVNEVYPIIRVFEGTWCFWRKVHSPLRHSDFPAISRPLRLKKKGPLIFSARPIKAGREKKKKRARNTTLNGRALWTTTDFDSSVTNRDDMRGAQSNFMEMTCTVRPKVKVPNIGPPTVLPKIGVTFPTTTRAKAPNGYSTPSTGKN